VIPLLYRTLSRSCWLCPAKPMPFRFPLAAVLHLRRSLEHQQELRLRAANQQVAKVRHLIEQLDEHIGKTNSSDSQQLAAGTTAAELRFALAKQASLESMHRDLDRELSRLSNLRDQQQRIFQQARRERETFESLRQQQLRAYERDQIRREQRRLDDLFLLSQAHKHSG